MTSKENLRQWLLSRAVSHDDAVIGSKLVAKYVAEVVRDDRVRRGQGGFNFDRAVEYFLQELGLK